MYILTKNRGWQRLRVRGLRRPIHVASLLEQNGLLPKPPYGERTVADQYCEAIQKFILPYDHPDHIDEARMFRVMGYKNVDGITI